MIEPVASSSRLIISIRILQDPSHKCESCAAPATFSVCEEGKQWNLCTQHTERKLYSAAYLVKPAK